MSYEQIDRLTPARLNLELRTSDVDPEVDERAACKLLDARAKAFSRVCEAYAIQPLRLAKIAAPDLAIMIRRVMSVANVDTATLPAQVAEFIEGLE